MGGNKKWSDEDVKTASELWMQGETASFIGERIGRTRNSVIGFIKRRKIKRDGTSINQQIVVDKSKPKSFKSSPQREKIANTAYGEKKTLHDLQRKECKWPIGDPKHSDFGFCAAQVEKGNYCEQHKTVGYMRPHKIKEKPCQN